MSSSAHIAYDPSPLDQRIHAQLEGLGELATYLTRSASSRATAGPSQINRAAAFREHEILEEKEEMSNMRRVHLGDEWWADMTESEMVGYLERKQAALKTLQERIQATSWPKVELADIAIDYEPPSADATDDPAIPTSSLQPVVPAPALTVDEHSDSSSDEEGPSTRPTRLLPAADQGEEQAHGVRDISKAIETLPESLRGPLKEILAAKDGTEVVNEDGLPVIDIREEVKPGQKGTVDVETVDQGKGGKMGKGVKEEDEYWSPAAIARRKKLREQLFSSDDSEDEDDEGETRPSSKSSSAEATSSQARSTDETEPSTPTVKPGFMLASRELKHSTPEDIATIDLVDTVPDISERATKADKGKGKGKANSETASSAASKEDETASLPQRRKSVTFAAQAKVRTYEKGEAIPVANAPADEEGETKQPAPVSPAAGVQKQGSDKLFGGFKKGFLNSSRKTSSTLPTRIVASPKVSLSKSSTKIEMIEDVASPAVSVKTAQVASQRKIISASKASKAAPPLQFRSEVAMDPDFALPKDLQEQLDQMTGQAPFPEPDSLQPLAPSHDDSVGAQRSKGKSLFAMRNQALANGLIPKRDAPTGNVSVEEPASGGIIGTGASRFDRAGDPTKFKVVEKPPRPVEKRAVSEVTERKPLKVASRPQKAVGGIVERKEAIRKTDEDAAEPIPLPVPDSINGDHQDNAAPMRTQTNTVDGSEKVEVTDTPEAQEDANDDEDEVDSNKSYEYSDTESVNFDMDRGLLAREAAMAYHQKRSALGRKALGGWTGVVDEDGKTAFYSDEVDEAQIKSEAVSFGEKLLSGANLRTFDVSNEDEDDDDIPSVNLPTIIPGADNLPSMIRVGKLENGNLILQAEDESEDEFADAPEGLKRETEEQKAWRADFREKMAAKDKKKEIVARLGKGEVDELIKEDEERENESKATRVVKEHESFLPQLREESASVKKPVDEIVTERSGKSPLVGSVKETGNVAETKPGDEPSAAVKPKKVSRFKAARMAGNGTA